MDEAYIYFVFSATPHYMGKFIRKITGEVYNHVSIALDEEMTQLYGFARRYYTTPFYGGFVRESHSRFTAHGENSSIKLCKLPVTKAQFEKVSNTLRSMYAQRDLYIYNHLSALGAVVHRPIKVKNAYTCVEFAVRILQALDFPLQSEKYYSVHDIELLLDSYCAYTGPMPQDGEYDTAFFSKKPVSAPLLVSMREMLKLLPRIGKE